MMPSSSTSGVKCPAASAAAWNSGRFAPNPVYRANLTPRPRKTLSSSTAAGSVPFASVSGLVK